jgi:hypothetical protein
MNKGIIEQINSVPPWKYEPLTEEKMATIIDELSTKQQFTDIIQYKIQEMAEVAKRCPYDMLVNDFLEQEGYGAWMHHVKEFDKAMRDVHREMMSGKSSTL